MPDSTAPKRNLAASVRQRLLNLAQQRQQPMDLVLTRYALERLLHRLSVSPHRQRFVLKGAMLLVTWFDEPHRATRDLDLLGFGDPSHPVLLATFRELMSIELDDALRFDLHSLRIEPIREADDYGGSRLRAVATLAGARIPVAVDIGFGDATEPGVQDITLPVLLDMPAPHLRAYAPETVIAEKFQAMVALGLANSRMKDYYDVWMLVRSFDLAPERVQRAITATFARRGTPLPTSIPDGLSDAFAADPAKRHQWTAFTQGLRGTAPDLPAVVRDLREALTSLIPLPGPPHRP